MEEKNKKKERKKKIRKRKDKIRWTVRIFDVVRACMNNFVLGLYV